jgi:uncharacterized phosphosugar-binding protein
MELATAYFREVSAVIGRIEREQTPNILAAAGRIVTTWQSGKKSYIFGCSHAGIVASEGVFRAGGLSILNLLHAPGLNTETRPLTLTSDMEKLDGYGTALIDRNGLEPGDTLILHSVSGRNNVPVDMALRAKEIGVYTICIVNLTYSRDVTSRHPSGKRLFELCDLIIDNCGCAGDAAVAVPGHGILVSPTSTVSGALIVNVMAAAVAERFAALDAPLPVFMSANLDGSSEVNRAMLGAYRSFITYL